MFRVLEHPRVLALLTYYRVMAYDVRTSTRAPESVNTPPILLQGDVLGALGNRRPYRTAERTPTQEALEVLRGFSVKQGALRTAQGGFQDRKEAFLPALGRVLRWAFQYEVTEPGVAEARAETPSRLLLHHRG